VTFHNLSDKTIPIELSMTGFAERKLVDLVQGTDLKESKLSYLPILICG
jgi:hypothetical protein